MKLQSNFTTPSQSQRLLELGLPADSADCYRKRIDAYADVYIKQGYLALDTDMPCWSVGRLIEIIMLCTDNSEYLTIRHNDGLVEYLIGRLRAANEINILNFSKLED